MKFFKQKESDTRHIGASGREKEQQKEQEFGPFFSQEISKSYLVIEPKIISGKMLIPINSVISYVCKLLRANTKKSIFKDIYS